MRVRKRKGAAELIAAHSDIVFTEKADWESVFGNAQPLEIEVGCGKGDFIVGMAKKYPEINFIGIDLQETVISYALDKVLASGLSNVKLLLLDGKELEEIFTKGSIAKVFLNFSDPWPKTRHEKRRLTYKSFLKIYEDLLVKDGELAFKTDNCGLFEYSLASMSQYGMVLDRVWLNLHANKEFEAENVQTEYEQKFSKKGPIYRLKAHF